MVPRAEGEEAALAPGQRTAVSAGLQQDLWAPEAGLQGQRASQRLKSFWDERSVRGDCNDHGSVTRQAPNAGEARSQADLGRRSEDGGEEAGGSEDRASQAARGREDQESVARTNFVPVVGCAQPLPIRGAHELKTY